MLVKFQSYLGSCSVYVLNPKVFIVKVLIFLNGEEIIFKIVLLLCVMPSLDGQVF